MKNSFLIIAIFNISLFSFSCRKYVEIGVPGKQVLTYTSDYQDLLNTPTNVEATMFYPALYSDDVDWQDSAFATKISADQASAYSWADAIVADATEDLDWSTLYKTVYYSNQVIAGVMSSQKGTTELKQNVQAQGYVTRAMAYYFLVNSYAKQYNTASASSDLGVPLVTDTKLVGVDLTRASVQTVYNQMLSDLKSALPYLDNTPAYTNLASKQGAFGILARVYLQMNQYDSAKAYADSALALNSNMDNLADYQSSFTSYPNVYNDKEILFEKRLRYSTPTLPLSASLIALYDQTSDLRYLLFTDVGTNYYPAFSVGRAYSKFKHIIPSGYINVGPTVPEMYLIRAEVEARANDIHSAMQDINTVRKHRYTLAGYSDQTASTKSECMQNVINERRRELVATGMRLFDLKRLNLESAYQVTLIHHFKNTVLTLAPNSNDYVLPIATKYIDLNPEIKQNER